MTDPPRSQVPGEEPSAKEALRRSEARYRALANASADVIYRMSPDWSEMRELDGRGFIADTPHPRANWLEAYIHPDDQPRVMAAVREAIRTRSVFELEHRVRRVDGTLGWTLSRAVPMLDEDGEIEEWVGATRDVTERKRDEEQVRRAHALIEGIARGTEDLIAAEDAEFRYTFFNEAYRREFRKLWGRDIQVGTSMVEAMAPWPEEQRKARELWDRALAGESFSVTMEFGPSGDEMQVYDLRFHPVHDGEGRQIGAAHIFRNVTEQGRMPEELRRSADQLRGLADAALAIHAVRDVGEMLDVITERARLLIGAHQAITSMTVSRDWAQAINAVSLSEKYAAWRDYDEMPDGSGIYRLVAGINRPMRLTQEALEAHPAWRGFGEHAAEHPPMRRERRSRGSRPISGTC